MTTAMSAADTTSVTAAHAAASAATISRSAAATERAEEIIDGSRQVTDSRSTRASAATRISRAACAAATPGVTRTTSSAGITSTARVVAAAVSTLAVFTLKLLQQLLNNRQQLLKDLRDTICGIAKLLGAVAVGSITRAVRAVALVRRLYI
ncbi:MAG: hypothetical protein ACFCUG_12560 [Thiotrichales bacterium]